MCIRDSTYFEKETEERPLRQCLNGSWLFSYAKNPSMRVERFYEDSYDCSGFDTIQVPGHLETQGLSLIHIFGKEMSALRKLYGREGK